MGLSLAKSFRNVVASYGKIETWFFLEGEFKMPSEMFVGIKRRVEARPDVKAIKKTFSTHLLVGISMKKQTKQHLSKPQP